MTTSAITRQELRRAAYGALLVTSVGALLSYSGLFAIARALGVWELDVLGRQVSLAGLYPLSVDGLAGVGYFALRLLPHQAKWERVYAGITLVVAALASGAAQGAHVLDVRLDHDAFRFFVAAWPALASAVALHLLHILAERSRAPEPARRPPVVVERAEPSQEAAAPLATGERRAVVASTLATLREQGEIPEGATVNAKAALLQRADSRLAVVAASTLRGDVAKASTNGHAPEGGGA